MTDDERKVLETLLWSDPASEAWEGDARSILADANSEPEPMERIRDLIEVVGAETGDAELEYEDDAEDLRSLASTAKRGAILLLHAAAAAELELKRL